MRHVALVLPKSSKLKNSSILFLPPSDHTLGRIPTFFLPLFLSVKCPTFSHEGLQGAGCCLCCGSPLSHDGMELQFSRLPGCSLFSNLSVTFPFGKPWKKNSNRGSYPFWGCCLAPVVRGLMGEVATGLVTTVPMGSAEFLSNELQSWSEIHGFW